MVLYPSLFPSLFPSRVLDACRAREVRGQRGVHRVLQRGNASKFVEGRLVWPSGSVIVFSFTVAVVIDFS